MRRSAHDTGIRILGVHLTVHLIATRQHNNIKLYTMLHQHHSTYNIHNQKYFKFQILQIETVGNQDQGLPHVVGYQELVTMSPITARSPHQ